MGAQTMKITILGAITIIAIAVLAILIIQMLTDGYNQGPQQDEPLVD
jgi:hypothetical protein